MKVTLTIFTPAYNRAHTLGRTYDSLCRQTSDDFEWLIIDDGSVDNTKELVRSWLSDYELVETRYELVGYSVNKGFRIHYVYQQNQGMHGAHNTAYDNLTTELNTCIDSDDYMPADAVERIVRFWQKLSDEQRLKYAGIVGLDITVDGKIIGSQFNASETTLMEYYFSGGYGDKKLVYRTDVVKRYPKYPIFPGEKYVGLASLYNMIDQDYKLLTLNEPLVVVEYQLEGSSANMYKQYVRNPKGFIYCRKKMLSYKIPRKVRFITCIHYVAEKLIAKEWNIFKDTPSPVYTLLTIPFGIVLYYLIRYRVKTDSKLRIENLKVM